MECDLSTLGEIPKKKRGRKRKLADVSLEESPREVAPISETTSRSGRRRKQINYYELANPSTTFPDFPDEPEESSNTKPKVEKKRAGRKPQKEKNRKLSGESFESEIDRPELNSSKSSNNSSGSKSEERNNLVEDSEVTLLDSANQVDTSNDLEEESNPSRSESEVFEEIGRGNRDKKYNYTGETVKMMNQLFTLYKSKNPSDGLPPPEVRQVSPDTSVASTVPETTIKKAKKGRPPKKKGRPPITEVTLSDSITCAVCYAHLEKTMWCHHKQRYHNNLAWRVGEPALDLSDQGFVMKTLNNLYKKKKPLYCDKCGELKKSVVGFLSHQSQCKKSEAQMQDVKIACEICNKRMLPVSLMTHMKFMHSAPKKVELEELPLSKDNKNIHFTKRNAARKAMKLINQLAKNDFNQNGHFTTALDLGSQEFAKEVLTKEFDENQITRCKFEGCDFQSKDVEETLEHLSECSKISLEAFACKYCLMVFLKLEDIILHVETVHDVEVLVEKDSALSDKPYNMSLKFPSFLDSSQVKSYSLCLFPGVFDWTYKFHEDNASELVFEKLSCNQSNWLLLPFNSAIDYLPQMEESCEVARTIVTSFSFDPLASHDHNFKRYELFETERHDDGKFTIFCGGPVTSVAWLPTPYYSHNNNQVLAVSVLNSPDEKYLMNERYSKRSAIQFWNFGVLRNKEDPIGEPKLVFNIAHDHGPVWHMEWCPSGCYDSKTDKFDRMGLLSITGSDSVVYIYAVPFFQNDEGLYYKAKPVLKLLLQKPGTPLMGGIQYLPRKISWSKTSGHSQVAVGYTNGFVGIFNLKTKSFVLKQKDVDDIDYILPYKLFQAHSHSVTALVLHPHNGGSRWLMTGSTDRNTSIWDLNDPSYPISNSKKHMVTDGFWFSNWLTYIVASDEGSTALPVSASAKQVRDYNSEGTLNFTYSQSSITAITGSDWLNGMIHGNSVGEIIATFPHQLICLYDMKGARHVAKKKLLFGYAHLLEKAKAPKERLEEHKKKKKVLLTWLAKRSNSANYQIPNKTVRDATILCDEDVVYDKVDEKYALLFCDNKMETLEDFPEETDKQLSSYSKDFNYSCHNQYPMATINTIVFNPNRQASLYYATGYQAGFVRVSWMKFLKDDSEIK